MNASRWARLPTLAGWATLMSMVVYPMMTDAQPLSETATSTPTEALTDTDAATATATASTQTEDQYGPESTLLPKVVLTETATQASEPTDPRFRNLETVSVHGRRVNLGRIAGSAHTISSEVLDTFEYDDAQRALLRVPGVYIRDEDGFGLRPNIGLRGASSDRSARVTLMEDGVLLAPAPYAAPAAYYFPLTTRMTEIEVFKGPAAIRHGPNTVGGAINLVSAPIPEQDTRAMIDVALGQFGYGKGHGRFGYGNDDFGFLLEGARVQSTGFKTLDGGGDTGFSKNEILAKARYNTDLAADIVHRFDVKFTYADETSYETYLGLTDEDFRQDGLRRYAATQEALMEWDRNLIQLGYSLDAGYGFHLNVVAYRAGFARAWRKLNRFADQGISDILLNPTGINEVYLSVLRGELDSTTAFGDRPRLLQIGTNDRSFVLQGIQLDGEWKETFSEDVTNRLMFGARFHYDRIRRDHFEESFDMIQGTLVPTPDTEILTLIENQDEATALAVYLQNELTLFEDLYITPGLRMEMIQTTRVRLDDETIPNQDNSDVVLIPGLGVYYQATNHLGLLAGVHQGFSPVAPGQEDDVKPETSLNYELGGRYTTNGFRSELIGYFNDYSNISGTCTFSSGCRDDLLSQQFNGGEVWVYGLEASAGISYPLWSDLFLTLDGTYTLTLSEFQTTFSSDDPLLGEAREGDQLPYLPVHQANVSLGVTSGPLGVFASYSMIGRMLDRAGNADDLSDNEKTDTQHIVDATLQYAFSSANRAYLRIDNLLNRTYIASRRPFGARPGKPFQVQLGYTHRFGD